MQRHAIANHFAIEDIQGSEQRGRPVTLVVMSESSASPGFHRQSRLSSIQRLDLTLLINAQHERRCSGEVRLKDDTLNTKPPSMTRNTDKRVMEVDFPSVPEFRHVIDPHSPSQ